MVNNTVSAFLSSSILHDLQKALQNHFVVNMLMFLIQDNEIIASCTDLLS